MKIPTLPPVVGSLPSHPSPKPLSRGAVNDPLGTGVQFWGLPYEAQRGPVGSVSAKSSWPLHLLNSSNHFAALNSIANFRTKTIFWLFYFVWLAHGTKTAAETAILHCALGNNSSEGPSTFFLALKKKNNKKQTLLCFFFFFALGPVICIIFGSLDLPLIIFLHTFLC